MKLKVKTCCGCWDLHTGTLIVGICGILSSIGGIFTHAKGIPTIQDETTKEEIEVGVGYSYLFIIISALLIYGTVKKSRYFLLPWLVYVAIGLGFFTVISLLALFFDPVALILNAIAVGLWYVWLCVLSYYQELNPLNITPIIYSDGMQVTSMPPHIATFAPQAPPYMDVIKGPQVTSIPPNIVTFASQAPPYEDVVKGPQAV